MMGFDFSDDDLVDGLIFDLNIFDMFGFNVLLIDIGVVIIVDNVYVFGYGIEDEMFNYFGGVVVVFVLEIFSCGIGFEEYMVFVEDMV